ncbi:MAG: hypothetical protein RLZZ618_3190, partial [Pseudomonadota bacterium]
MVIQHAALPCTVPCTVPCTLHIGCAPPTPHNRGLLAQHSAAGRVPRHEEFLMKAQRLQD